MRESTAATPTIHLTAARVRSIDVGEAETEAFWTAFLGGLVKRGLVGAQLAISDAHAGLKALIANVLGCAWQRCTVHFRRDWPRPQAPTRPAGRADPPDLRRRHARAKPDRLSEAAAHLEGRLGKIATMLEDAEHDTSSASSPTTTA